MKDEIDGKFSILWVSIPDIIQPLNCVAKPDSVVLL